MNNIKFIRLDVSHGKPVAVFQIEKYASKEIIEYDKKSFLGLPMTRETLIVFKWLNEFEIALKRAMH